MTRFVLDSRHEVDDDPGVEGNTRLTASTGLVLTVLLLIEGFTILDVRGYITLHTVIGLILIGPIALKSATTTHRMISYYRRRTPYVRRGAPPIVLRVIGPFVVLSSIAVLATGIALLVTRDRSDTWLTLHQASFFVWVALTGLHFLAHIVEAVRGTAREFHRDAASGRRQLRVIALVLSLVVGIGLAAAFTPSASSWHMRHHFDRHSLPAVGTN